MWGQIQSEVIEVLHNTHDGNDLCERDLALCELALNRNLSPLGVIVFQDLVKRIGQGDSSSSSMGDDASQKDDLRPLTR